MNDRSTQDALDAPRHESIAVTVAITLIGGVQLVVLVAIFAAAGMPPLAIALLAAWIAFFPPILIAVFIRLTWTPVLREHPSQPILPGAVSRSFQSFAFGTLGRYNNCLNLTADEQHLHIEGFAPFRWLGARRISVPWDRLSDVRPSFWPGMMKAKLGGRPILGPTWCIKLAAPPEDEPV